MGMEVDLAEVELARALQPDQVRELKQLQEGKDPRNALRARMRELAQTWVRSAIDASTYSCAVRAGHSARISVSALLGGTPAASVEATSAS